MSNLIYDRVERLKPCEYFRHIAVENYTSSCFATHIHHTIYNMCDLSWSVNINGEVAKMMTFDLNANATVNSKSLNQIKSIMTKTHRYKNSQRQFFHSEHAFAFVEGMRFASNFVSIQEK